MRMSEKKGTALILDGLHGLRGLLDQLDRDIAAWSTIEIRRSLPGGTVDTFVDGVKRHLLEQIEAITQGRQDVLREKRKGQKK
jgi:hypothetical protein